ncbi:MAG: hypothetical protein LBG70_03100, partial [Bifidobacteriaceae bacterium]|nr:hypothetical protein [Bifidobacteriaceae bacterium]
MRTVGEEINMSFNHRHWAGRRRSMHQVTSVVAAVTVLVLATSGAALSNAAPATPQPQTTSSPNQDVHDDRPDDTNDRPDEAGSTVDTANFPSSQVQAWAGANSFDLNAFMNPPDPTTITPHEPSASDIEWFNQWIVSGGNPRNMVMKSVTAAVGQTVANEMWDYLNTVWATWMHTAN